MKRHVFIISDGTGITAESLGNSLLTQFEGIDFEKQSIPYVDSIEKAEKVAEQIDNVFSKTQIKPLVFVTLVNPEISTRISETNACIFDLFSTFLAPLEKELNAKSSYRIGRTHGVSDFQTYNQRIDALNYTLGHDDGIALGGYNKADIIFIGVSRSGKTPSCLYMALQFGVFAANYPLTDDDLSYTELPESLRPYKDKLFGLSIDLERLQAIRTERKPNSRYASRSQCQQEISEVEVLFKKEKIPFINATRYSIEEIATRIMAAAKIKRRF